jgi:hypothetical protein
MDDDERKEALTRLVIRDETDEDEKSEVIHQEAAARVRRGASLAPASSAPSVSPAARGIVHVLNTLPAWGRVLVLFVALVILGFKFAPDVRGLFHK